MKEAWVNSITKALWSEENLVGRSREMHFKRGGG